VVQTVEPRVFPESEIRQLTEAASRVAHVVSEARTLDRFIAPAQERLWALAATCGGAGSRFGRLVPRYRSVALEQLNHSPVSLLSEYPLAKLEARANELALHSRINYAYRRLREYEMRSAPGVRAMPACCGPRPVAYFSAEFACTNLCRSIRADWEFWPAITSRAPPISASPRRHRPVYGQGYSASASIATAGSTKSTSRPMSINWHGDGHRHQRPTRGGAGRYPPRCDLCQSLARESGPVRFASARFDVEGHTPEDREMTSRLYGGDGRVRVHQELLLGVGGLRALRALGITPGVSAPERRTQRICRLEAIRQRMDTKASASIRPCRGCPRSGFTTIRPCPPATTVRRRSGRGTPRTVARSSRSFQHASWRWDAKIPTVMNASA